MHEIVLRRFISGNLNPGMHMKDMVDPYGHKLVDTGACTVPLRVEFPGVGGVVQVTAASKVVFRVLKP